MKAAITIKLDVENGTALATLLEDLNYAINRNQGIKLLDTLVVASGALVMPKKEN